MALRYSHVPRGAGVIRGRGGVRVGPGVGFLQASARSRRLPARLRRALDRRRMRTAVDDQAYQAMR
jgi:hypothetical protein